LVAYHGRANERRQEDHRKAKGRLTFKQRTSVGLACVAVLAPSAYGHYWWTVDRFFQSTDDAYVGGNVTPISPHISGFIAAILVGDNQRVKAGQLVVRLDDRDVRAAADHAEAILKARKSDTGEFAREVRAAAIDHPTGFHDAVGRTAVRCGVVR
jgi:multidrug resistance efflux pump